MRYQRDFKKCQREGLPTPQQPDIIGKYILELCKNLGTRHNFHGYSFLDTMIGEAIENLCKAVLKYNPRKTDNIFNYFTTVAWRAFQFRILEEREQNAVKHKYYQYTYRINELEGTNILDLSDNEYSNRIIDEFERKNTNKTTPYKKIARRKSPPPKKKRGVEKLLVTVKTKKH